MNVSQMRAEYGVGALRREDLSEDPFEQFGRWIEEACRSEIVEPNALSLATVAADGRPTLRTVLLKTFDARGFVFFTNLESRKAQQISENPNVSMLFPWLALQRQVSVNGTAERISTAEAIAYFATRPFASQLAAWVSPQSKIVSARSLLEMKWEEAKRKFTEGKVPMPSFWGGFRVKPREIEFWQGREHRLHDRFLYSRRPDETWGIERLGP
jgi:pyridoxamine 5'-phosphate oxidase